MNDLELLDKWCDTCLEFIDPFTFREVEKRGLAHIVNRLPKNRLEAKSIIRARLAKINQAFGDDEIDNIANQIKRLEALRHELNNINMADAHKIKPILNEMQDISDFVLDYFKPVKFT